MKIFQLEAPIAAAIQGRFIAEVSSEYANADKNILFLSHEPPEGEIFSYTDSINANNERTDGVVAVYAEDIEQEPSSSQTSEPETVSVINVDCYGYGDVFRKNSEMQKSSISAQNRAQVLTSISYNAIMGAEELSNAFGSEIKIAERTFQRIQKVGAIGPEDTNRTICFYRSQYRIRLEEDIPTETLGPEYAGGSPTQETSNP